MKNEKKSDPIPNADGFRLPEAYFESLSERITEVVDLHQVLPSKEGYTLPEGYFTDLENRLKSIPENTKSKVIPLRRIMQWTTAAAVLALVLWAGWWKNYQTSPLHDLETLSQTEIQYYLENRSSEWDAYILGDLFSYEQLDEIALGDIPLSDEELMQYLMEQEVFPEQP